MTPGYDDLSRLYRSQAKALLLFFQRRVDDPELATDLMADTFTLALERRDQFRGSSDDELSGWLWSIAQSILREHERRGLAARRNARRLGRDRRALTDQEIERIEELAAIAKLGEAVFERLDRLPADQREAVRLRLIEELPYSEIAARLGISESGTRTRVTRALQQLAAELEVEHESWKEEQ